MPFLIKALVFLLTVVWFVVVQSAARPVDWDDESLGTIFCLQAGMTSESVYIPLPEDEKKAADNRAGQPQQTHGSERQTKPKEIDPQKIVRLPEKCQRGHFVIYHDHRDFANNFSWKAEYHYKRILRHIGDADFKPWEDEQKCPVYLYETSEDYQKASGAPAWSAGLAHFEPMRFFTFESAPNLFTNILPHEMAHLLMKLYMGKTPIPLWLNEGLAQYEEEGVGYRPDIKATVRQGIYIPLEQLFSLAGYPQDEQTISLFYAQSASIIDYLRRGLIASYFSRFLAELKKGKTVEQALKEVYQWKFKEGIPDLERRWIKYVKENY